MRRIICKACFFWLFLIFAGIHIGEAQSVSPVQIVDVKFTDEIFGVFGGPGDKQLYFRLQNQSEKTIWGIELRVVFLDSFHEPLHGSNGEPYLVVKIDALECGSGESVPGPNDEWRSQEGVLTWGRDRISISPSGRDTRQFESIHVLRVSFADGTVWASPQFQEP